MRPPLEIYPGETWFGDKERRRSSRTEKRHGRQVYNAEERYGEEADAKSGQAASSEDETGIPAEESGRNAIWRKPLGGVDKMQRNEIHQNPRQGWESIGGFSQSRQVAIH